MQTENYLTVFSYNTLSSFVNNASMTIKDPNQISNTTATDENNLSTDMILAIFNELSLLDLLNCSLVCRRWKAIEGGQAKGLYLHIGQIGQNHILRLPEQHEISNLMPNEQKIEWLQNYENHNFAQMLFHVGCDTFCLKELKDLLAVTTIIHLERAANKGCIKSQCIVGQYYFYGVDVIKDTQKALSYLNKAVENEESIAQYEMGKYYLCNPYGADSEKNEERGIALLRSSADSGKKTAQRALATRLYNRETLEEEKEAFPYFLLAAEQGDAFSLNQLNFFYSQGICCELDLTKAKDYLLKAVEQNFGPALSSLSANYRFGNYGFEKNISQAIHYAKLAAPYGEIRSLSFLCKSSGCGIGTVVDKVIAARYFKSLLTALRAPPYVMHKSMVNYDLGTFYESGFCGSRDLGLAFHYYSLAKEHDPQLKAATYYKIATFYEEGGPIPQNPKQMMMHYKFSADMKNVTSCFKMCQLLSIDKNGIERDPLQAAHYFQILLSLPNEDISVPKGFIYGYISLCYAHGWGVEHNQEQAEIYLEQAANNEHAAAQFRLCRRFTLGEGKEVDLEKATYYFNLLSDPNHSELLHAYRVAERYRRISECYQYGFGTAIDLEKADFYEQIANGIGEYHLTYTWIL